MQPATPEPTAQQQPDAPQADAQQAEPSIPGRVLGGLRLSISTLTMVRAGVPRVDRRTAGAAMVSAPLVGLGVGAVAAGVGQLADWWTQSAFVAGVLAICTLAAVTRGLHLDGLADTADGLGSNRPADEALRIMKRSDIGAFGVVAVVLVLTAQISGLTAAYTIHRGAVAVIVAAVTGRLAVTAACSAPVPSARPEGLGAWVARSVRMRTALAVGVLALVACGALGLIIDAQTATLAVAAVPLGVGAAFALLYRCVERFGGITGDVLGAVVETATAVALLVLAMRP